MHTHTQAHSLGPLQHFHPTLRVHNRPVCKRAALWSLAHPFAEQSGCSVGRSAVYGAACFTIICCDSVCVCVWCVDTECNKSLSRWSRWESRYSGLNEQSLCVCFCLESVTVLESRDVTGEMWMFAFFSLSFICSYVNFSSSDLCLPVNQWSDSKILLPASIVQASIPSSLTFSISFSISYCLVSTWWSKKKILL